MGIKDRFRGSLLGLAVGDAVGTTLEFGNLDPPTGYGWRWPFHLDLGEWTDDTSMALCLAVVWLSRKALMLATRWNAISVGAMKGYMSSTCLLEDGFLALTL